ncbi:KRT15 isoform 3 [Pan troglodytes]|uniref:KRT15 isoform 3 n=1 Tax=Pan troglodytes TaxID=9598 RepID=A0A2J8KGB0_PANTR|nr:KRT15 isoform 3 [Pan troglodytes]
MTGTRSRPQPAQNATTANTSRPLKSSGTRSWPPPSTTPGSSWRSTMPGWLRTTSGSSMRMSWPCARASRLTSTACAESWMS